MEVTYSKPLTKETLKLLASPPDHKKTGVYATYSKPGTARLGVEVNRVWANCVDVTSLTTGERMTVEDRYLIHAGQPGTLLSLEQQVKEYENRIDLRID